MADYWGHDDWPDELKRAIDTDECGWRFGARGFDNIPDATPGTALFPLTYHASASFDGIPSPELIMKLAEHVHCGVSNFKEVLSSPYVAEAIPPAKVETRFDTTIREYVVTVTVLVVVTGPAEPLGG